ncbi:MAG: ATPase domain-containing protein, partial [Ktedonobacterales bacterium]
MSDTVDAHNLQGVSPDESENEHLLRDDEGAAPLLSFSLTGVPNLDTILGGGIPKGALTLMMGAPGSGKTSLASQIAFGAAHNGQRILVLTALSESTNKLIEHLRNFAFFDSEVIGREMQFFSLQSVLSQGLVQTRGEILRMVRQTRANMLMMDGFRGIREIEGDASAARQFLYEIGTGLGALRITTLITSETDPHDPTFFPETTTADVILGLHYHLLGARQTRAIEVIKARGVAPLPGLHALTLNSFGCHVYPQLEERVALEAQARSSLSEKVVGGGIAAISTSPSSAPSNRTAQTGGEAEHSITFGLPHLDAMMRGGVGPTTSTVVAGSLGSGKTLIALHFALAGARTGAPSIYLSFREDAEQLLRVVKPFAIGAEIQERLQPGGGMTILWAPPIKLQPDIIAEQLLTHLDAVGPCRLVVDGIVELERAIARSADPGRLEDYLAALVQALRHRQVTPLFVVETGTLVTATLDFSADPLSILAENIMSLRQVIANGKVRRILTLLKMRYSTYDTSVREFVIAPPDGIRVLGSL